MIPRSLDTIRWVATYKERTRHAYFGNEMVCALVHAIDPEYWLRTKKQPQATCKRCRIILIRGNHPGPAQRQSKAER